MAEGDQRFGDGAAKVSDDRRLQAMERAETYRSTLWCVEPGPVRRRFIAYGHADRLASVARRLNWQPANDWPETFMRPYRGG